MTIQYKFFTISVSDGSVQEEELNRFLRQVRLVHLQKEFVNSGEHSLWAVSVEYLLNGSPSLGKPSRSSGKKQQIDYKEVLSPEAFSVFALLRDWRKAAALKEAVPVYTLFSNEQLAAMVKSNARSLSDLAAIDGIGKARIGKWGDAVLEILASHPLQAQADDDGAE